LHRTQIYIDEDLFEQIKARAKSTNLSISEYIRQILRRDIQKQRKSKKRSIDLTRFTGMWNTK